jgi:AraC family transcriptional regulator
VKATFEIKEMPAYHVAAMRHVGPYNQIGLAMERLFAWAGPRGLLRFPDTKVLAVYYDDPETVDPSQLRSDACLTVPEGTSADAGATTMTIPGGLFAVGHFEIDQTEYGAAWGQLVGEYLPTTLYQSDNRLCYEMYLNDPDEHPEHKHIVDMCEPVRPAS